MWIAAILLALVIAIFVTQPLLLKAVMSKYKSTDQFLVLEQDARINYEAQAKDNALVLRTVLDSSQKAVEDALGAAFSKPIEVYVCASQEVFNEYVFLSRNVRGAVYWGKLFLSPGAFNRGSLAELTTHELTHYLFFTHLGEKAHIEGIPLWFREGIAVYVANGGARYTKDRAVSSVMRNDERTAYLSGRVNFWFHSKDPRDAVTKSGVPDLLLYNVGALFVHFMHDSEPVKFDKLIQLLLSGTEFDQALQVSYARNTESLLQEFTRYLTQNVQL